jgi:pimeloyl-ACP methyl ester carboxylesterase
VRRFRTSDGLSLAYRDEGSGLPLLCLAGLTRNGDDFAAVAAAFRGEARIVRLDSRGRGGSDRDPNIMNYTPWIEARDALELLDHLGIARAAVLGTSRGGMLAMLMGMAARERLLGVILNDIGPVIEPAGLESVMSYLGLPPPDRSLDAAAVRLAGLHATDFPGVTPAAWRRWAAGGFRETAAGLELRYDPALRAALLRQAEAGPLPDLWPVFDALAGVPLALIRGANSNLLAAATAEAMQARRPDMLRVDVADRGHVPFLDEPRSLAAIREILGRARQAAAAA